MNWISICEIAGLASTHNFILKEVVRTPPWFSREECEFIMKHHLDWRTVDNLSQNCHRYEICLSDAHLVEYELRFR